MSVIVPLCYIVTNMLQIQQIIAITILLQLGQTK